MIEEVRPTVMTYSFACPVPCNREIRVQAKDNLDAVDKIILAGAISCRNGKNRSICEEARFVMPPMPEEQLRNIVGLCIREENDGAV
jgi:hypothetical protein